MKLKPLKGYVYIDLLERGWSSKGDAAFIYRKKSKSETWFIPVEIRPLPIKRKKK